MFLLAHPSTNSYLYRPLLKPYLLKLLLTVDLHKFENSIQSATVLFEADGELQQLLAHFNIALNE